MKTIHGAIAAFSLILGLDFCLPALDGGGKQTGPREQQSWQAVDRHALQAPRDVEASIAALGAYLTKASATQAGKVRAIFRWMTDRIAFNAADFAAGKQVPAGAEEVLKNRSGVCEGHANLFMELCREGGIEAVRVLGFSRGYAPNPDAGVRPNHAWNAVKVDGQWRLVDVTWGAGGVNAKGFTKRFDEYYFFPSPEGFIFHHFPDEPRWQLLDPPVTAEAFLAWPTVDLQLFRFGIDVRALQTAIRDKDVRSFVKTYDPRGAAIRLVDVPVQKELKAGETYQFRVEAPTCQEMAFLHAGRNRALSRRGRVFEAKASFRPGTLKLRGIFTGKGNTYWSILEYEVKD